MDGLYYRGAVICCGALYLNPLRPAIRTGHRVYVSVTRFFAGKKIVAPGS